MTREEGMEIGKLIDALRVCADDDIICPACERYDKMDIMGGAAACVSKLLLEAAAGLEEQRERIAELEEQRRWIPVKEKRSEIGQYLCVVLRPIPGGSYVRELRVLWSNYDNRWNCEDLIVTHWMPLPELPKEVE